MTNPHSGSGAHAPGAPVDETLVRVVGGLEQTITLRGADAANPLLFLISGAGAALSPMADFFTPWERAFTLVHWDQPNAGATLARHGFVEPFGYERLAQDAATVAEIVLARLGARRLTVIGLSMGTVTALKLAHARPDLVGVYVACGQITHWPHQQAHAYDLALDRAGPAAAADLLRIGPPPWEDLDGELTLSAHANVPTVREQAAMAGFRPPSGQSASHQREAARAAYLYLKPELDGFDAMALGPIATPMVFLQGEEDRYTPTADVEAYARAVQAPAKAFVTLAGAGHNAMVLREDMLTLLVEHVRPLALDAEDEV